MIDQYAPTSGTEAMDFMGKWCGRCICDANEDCPVLAVVYSYGFGAGNPPSEWQYERGEPVCTAFNARDPLDLPLMRAAVVKDLFSGARKLPTAGEQVRMIVTEQGAMQ
jgi:hypothetical protein